jgi:hypothetical protein
MAFEWITLNGSCDACLALEGYHDEAPQRPHDYCDCEIFDDIFEENEGLPPGTCWGEVDEGGDLYVDGVVMIAVDVFKVCADGDEVHGSFEMEQTFDEWYDAWIEDPNGEEWQEWHDEVWDRIDGMCAHELEYECTTFVDPTP